MSINQPKHFKIKTPTRIRQFSVCRDQNIFLALVYDTVRLYDRNIQGGPIYSIKFDITPRSAKLSYCGKYFYVHDSNNLLHLYDTKTGTVLQEVTGLPPSTKPIKFSQNSQKIIFGSTQTLCLWDIRRSRGDFRTQQWKNISCYDLNQEGKQFVLGTYDGKIFVLEMIDIGKCSQIQINRHKTCVASICCHKDQIISASHDNLMVISKISKNSVGEVILSYREMKMMSIPKEFQSTKDKFYMFNHEGMTWFSNIESPKLTGFTDSKVYKVIINQNGQTTYVIMDSKQIQWWSAQAFKTQKQIQRERLEKQVEKYMKEKEKENKIITKIYYYR